MPYVTKMRFLYEPIVMLKPYYLLVEIFNVMSQIYVSK